MSRARELEEQVEFLRWTRIQKDNAIKKAVEHSLNLHERDSMLHLISSQETDRILWRRSVIEDEMSRPLVLKDEELVELKKFDQKQTKKFSSVSIVQTFIVSYIHLVHRMLKYTKKL